MKNYFQIIKDYLLELEVDILRENESKGILVIEKEAFGVKNLILGIAPPILIAEQFLFEIKKPSLDIYQALLQKNRDIIHGAFVLDDTGTRVIFRDSLQIENLDLNEIEATLNSLGLLLSEYSDEIINFSKH
jgi:hypothetical protein